MKVGNRVKHRRRRSLGSVKTRASSRQQSYTPDPKPVLSVIIPVMNEQRTLGRVIAEAYQVHPKTEVIVVANGCKDKSAKVAKVHGARVLEYRDPLGHDVPRRVGAEAALGEILLFIDGDMVIPARQLKPFVTAILSGIDVALNGYNGPVGRPIPHPVVLAKYTLNLMLARPDLEGASLTAVPHAMSRRALGTIGLMPLENPPSALARAVLQGLRVEIGGTVGVGRMNRRRWRESSEDPLISLVAGDHLEALTVITAQRGERGGYPDLDRQRDQLR